jgi:DNA mismatch repair protein MutH
VAGRELNDDWESVALRLVAGRVESLTTPAGPVSPRPPPADGEPATDEGFGWEEAVLQRLRARLFSDDFAD